MPTNNNPNTAGLTEIIEALRDLRAGVELDKHNAPNAAAKLAGLDLALAALARQEPVAWTIQDQLDRVAAGEVGFIARQDMIQPAPDVALYAAPVAERPAVDLEQFRGAVLAYRWTGHYNSDTDRIAEANRLLAIIDSQKESSDV